MAYDTPYETKPNTGAAFKNTKRTKDEATHKQPYYTGHLFIEGVAHFVDVWINVAQSGDKYLKLKVKRMDKQPSAKPYHEPDDRGLADELSDEIPF